MTSSGVRAFCKSVLYLVLLRRLRGERAVETCRRDEDYMATAEEPQGCQLDSGKVPPSELSEGHRTGTRLPGPLFSVPSVWNLIMASVGM